jgi:centrosomal protein CEP19
MPFMSNSITPIKLGVKFDPPSIVLYYRDKSKLRSRQIPCRDVDILTDVTLYVDKFKVNPKNKTYFEKVSNKRIEKVVFILQDNMKGYTLKESLQRAKKYDNRIESDDDGDDDRDMAKKNKSKLRNSNDYEDDDFHDTDDESVPPSVSTIEDNLKAKKEITLNLMDALAPTKISIKKDSIDFAKNNESPISKSTALDLLSTQIKSVKNSIYDFEDDAEDEIDENINPEYDDDDEGDDDLVKKSKNKNKNDDKFEVAPKDDLSDSSF